VCPDELEVHALTGPVVPSRRRTNLDEVPWSITTMRSATLIASSWSWVTNTIVVSNE
jgi:hypothetical protein